MLPFEPEVAMRPFFLSFLLLPGVIAQTLPDADALVKNQADSIKKHASMRYDGDMDIEMTGQMPMKMSGEISMAFQNPGKIRMDSKIQGISIIMVSDGETTWAYNSMANQYVKKNVAMGPAGIVQLMGLQNVPDISKVSTTSKTLRDETLEMDGQKHDCWVVETKVGNMEIPQAAGAKVSDMEMTTWLDKKLGIDLQFAVSMKMDVAGNSIGMNQKLVKKNLKLDEPMPDSYFAFTPPEGATETENLMGSTLPKADLAGKDALAFDIKALDGKSYSLAKLKGKPVLLDFWATWCGPCRKSMPAVEKMYQDFKEQGLVVLAVDAGEERAVVEEFLKKTPMPYPVALSGESSITESYHVGAFPTFVMIGRDGKIVAHEIGYGGEAVLRDMAQKAGLAEAAAKEK
jgi:thiol-disulfide isomerase/thioredoxin